MTDNDAEIPVNYEPQARELLLTQLLASDLAVEISAEFNGRRAVGFDVPAATAHVLAKFHSALSSAQDGPVFLIALAALQVRADYVQQVIRDAAVDLIETGEAAEAYKSADFAQRKSVGQLLEQFAAILAAARVTD